MKLSAILFATLVVTATASTLDFTCGRDDVAVCCRNRDDDFDRCDSAERLTGTRRDERHPEYYCRRRDDYARCCEAHDYVEQSNPVATTTATEIIIATQPVQIQTETIYIQYTSQTPQQQDVTEIDTIYQTYAFTIAKRYAEPEATAVADAEVRRRRCKVLQ